MPISEPYKARSISPDSLAFDTRGGVSGITIQQQQSEWNQTNNFVTTGVDESDLYGHLQATATADRDSEYRSKFAIGNWHGAWDADLSATQTITNNAIQPLRYNRIVIPFAGLHDKAAQWTQFTCPAGYDGVWVLTVHIKIAIPAAANVGRVQLGFDRNETLLFWLDDTNAAMAGTTPIQSAVLRGTRTVRLRAGDRVRPVIRLLGAAGSTSYTAPTSLQGYVCGHRASCDTTQLEIPSPLNNFVYLP